MDPSLPYSRPYRVRFDEAGADGSARASTLVRYIQDVAWQHSEAAGFDRDWYAARGLGWLVRGVELALGGAAGYGETLTVTTRITGWRRMWARRQTEVTSQDGRSVATAATDWVLLSAAGRPVRIPPEIEAFAPRAAAFAPIRVVLPSPPPDATLTTVLVRATEVDPMGHLNNAAYLDLLTDAAASLGRAVAPSATLRLEYAAAALPGMALASLAWADGPGLAWRLRETGGSADLLRATVS